MESHKPATMAKVESTLRELTIQIDEMESTRAELLRQVDAINFSLTRKKAKYWATINRKASISRLPAEILAKVFEAGQDLGPPKAEIPFEILVSQVMTYWRDVAIHTPSLWNIIDISPTRPLESLKYYVARSKASFLNVRFDFTRKFWVPEPDVWDLILPHTDRWHRLFIFSNSHHSAVYTTLAQLELLAAPRLEEISISQHGDPGDLVSRASNNLKGYRYWPTIFNGGAPMLSFVKLEGIGLSSNWPPLTALTTLYLHDLLESTCFTWTRLRQILTEPSSLSTLSIHGIMTRTLPPPDFEIEMPALRSLRIRGTHQLNRRVSDLLLVISASNLECLILMDIIDDDLIPFFQSPQISSDFSKFPCLHSLTFKWTTFSPATYEMFFRAIPSITHFTLFDRHADNILLLFGEYQCRSSTQLPWPHLEDVSLYPAKAHKAFICDMVYTRYIGHRPITTLRLDDQNNVQGIEWLRRHLRVMDFDAPPPWPAW